MTLRYQHLDSFYCTKNNNVHITFAGYCFVGFLVQWKKNWSSFLLDQFIHQQSNAGMGQNKTDAKNAQLLVFVLSSINP